MKLALYGGSFDPPHAGHVAVVTEALKHLDVDRLIIIPASQNPLKSPIRADGGIRYEWLREIFKPYTRVSISDFEITQKRSVYTIETVNHFWQEDASIYLIIGADNLEKLASWHRYEELNSLVKWVVATRNDITIPKRMIRLNVDVPISSTDFRTTFGSLGLNSELEHQILTYYKEHQ
jgi:nicotinate-nucleotide adenylyltransferase